MLSEKWHMRFNAMRFDKFYCIAVIGVVIAIAGAGFSIFWADILDSIIFKEKVITPTSKTFKIWRRPPFPIHWSITLFNWSNAEDFLERRATKPSFTEVGPFLYTETMEKVDVRFNTKNSTVSYRKRSFFTPNEIPVDEAASLDENVTSINMIALSSANRAHYWGYAAERGISFALYTYRQQITVTKRAAELLFEGYPEPMIDRAKEILKFLGNDIEFDGRFSWLRPINGSKKIYGYFNMDTGKEDSSQYGLTRRWNYRSHSDTASGECGSYAGFTGELFPTKIRKDQPLRIFTPETCRLVLFEFEKEEQVHGVTGYRFVGNERTMDNGSLYAENQCNMGGEFMPSGVLNITECKLGTPMFISFPHFFAGDSFYGDHIEGMKPDRENHQFFFVVEPTTGVLMNASFKIQINVLLQRYSGVALFQDVPRSYIPVLWFTRSFTLPREEILKLKGLLDVSQLGYIGGFAAGAVGAVIALLAIALRCVILKSGRNLSRQKELRVTNGNTRGSYECVQSEPSRDKERIKL